MIRLLSHIFLISYRNVTELQVASDQNETTMLSLKTELNKTRVTIIKHCKHIATNKLQSNNSNNKTATTSTCNNKIV